MSNSPRRAAPRLPSQPDYLLRVTDATGRVMWHTGIDDRGFATGTTDEDAARKFRGAGLARAKVALRKRGYVVEKVLCTPTPVQGLRLCGGQLSCVRYAS